MDCLAQSVAILGSTRFIKKGKIRNWPNGLDHIFMDFLGKKLKPKYTTDKVNPDAVINISPEKN